MPKKKAAKKRPAKKLNRDQRRAKHRSKRKY